MKKDTIRCATYFRMSTTKQEDSIERQQSQVAPHAAKCGYTVVASYQDEGIAGDEVTKRRGFQRMLADAAAHKFDVILVDDKDRFGRFDSITHGEIAGPLRRAGVRLETVAQGRVDWESFGGRITDAVLQEARKLESVAIARRVASSMLMLAKQGKWQGHAAPFGYRLEPHAIYGKIPVPDGRNADVVRFMFKHIDEGGTIGTLQDALYARGIATPRAGRPRWPRATLFHALINPTYSGSYVFGKVSSGKYFRVHGGDVRATASTSEKARLRDACDWVAVPDHHEALVDRETFARVRAKIRGNKARKTPIKGGGDFIFTGGLLVCANCGSTMLGFTDKGHRVYGCSGFMSYGKEHCTRNTVRESVLLDTALSVLRTHFLNPTRLAAFRDEVRRQEKAERAPSALASLKKKVAELTAKIDRGVSNTLLAEPSTVPMLTAALAVLRQERESVVAELQRIETTSRVDDLEEKIKRVEGYLFRLEEATGSGERGQLRQLLREVITKIELHFSHVQKAKLRFSKLERGVIYVRGEEQSAELVAGGLPAIITPS